MSPQLLPQILSQAFARLQQGALAAAQQTLEGHGGLALRHEAGLTLLGVIQLQRGETEQALASFDRAIALAPGFPDAHANRGQVLRQQRRLEEALESYDEALALRPEDPATHCNRGNVLADLERQDEAIAAYDRALALNPGEPVALANRAAALQDLERYEEALAAYDSLLATHPDYAVAHCNQSHALHALGDFEAALAAADRALRLKPNYPKALANRGIALKSLGWTEAALEAFDATLRLEPDLGEAHRQRGLALQELGRFEDALLAFERALEVEPRRIDNERDIATALRFLGRRDEAISHYARVLEDKPDDPVALFGCGLIRLQRGELAAGWRDYEARWRTCDFQGKGPEVEAPLWDGQDLSGKRLLVHAEQGLGDCIQFVRYLRLIPAEGGQVALWIRPSLMALLRDAFEGVQLLDSSVPVTGEFDYHLPMMSLPRVFGTTLDSIPAGVPYLAAEPARVAAWRERLGRTGLRVGIAWQGNPVGQVDRGRSMPLRHFAPLAAVPGVRLISLQTQHGLEQLDSLPPGMAVETLGPGFDAGPDAFLDAAAVMACCDLMVVSDSALAHLAGAMARPAWLALKRVPDWRWFLDRTDSPWYPSLRLFRQPRDGDWDSVFAAMAEVLAARAEGRPGP